MQEAQATSSVLLLHAHTPGTSISLEAIECVLAMADEHRLAFLTFRELDPAAPPRAGLALAFDGNAIDGWFGVRELLETHPAQLDRQSTSTAHWLLIPTATNVIRGISAM